MNEVNYSVPLEQGAPFVERLTDPAGGANLLFVIPNHLRIQLESIRLTFATDATAVTRRFNIRFFDATGIITQKEWTVSQAATLTRFYHAVPQDVIDSTLVGNNLYGPLGYNGVMLPNQRLEITFNTIQAGDAITDAILSGKRWVERNV